MRLEDLLIHNRPEEACVRISAHGAPAEEGRLDVIVCRIDVFVVLFEIDVIDELT